MRLVCLVMVVVLSGTVLCGKGGRGGGAKGGNRGGGGWYFGKSKKKPVGEPNYPRQPAPQAPPHPQDSGWKPPDSRPPAYNPGYPGPPPTYSKNAPAYPQSGGHAPPPPYSQYPQPGHLPQYPGYGQGYPQSGFPQYPQQYGGGYGHGGGYGVGSSYGRGFGFPGIIPIPIPIPFGGGGFGYGSYGGGYNRHRGSSNMTKEGAIATDDSEKRPRVMAPPDFELDGVIELPSDMPYAKWDIVGKETAAKKLKKRNEDYSGEFD